MKIQEVYGLLFETNKSLCVREILPSSRDSLNYCIHCATHSELMQWNVNAGIAAWWVGGCIHSDTLCSIYDVHTHIWEYL